MLVEFDVRRGVRTPGVFVVPSLVHRRYLPRGVLASVAALVPGVSVADLHAVVESVVCEGARIGSVGVFPGRSPPSVRVDAVLPDPGSGFRLVHRLGWPGDRLRLGRLLRVFARGAVLWLGFDFVSGPVPVRRLGLEVHGGPCGWVEPSVALWRFAVAVLSRERLILPEKGRAVLAFHGPARARAYGTSVQLNRGVNHVKIVFDGGRVSAKGYLGLNFRDPHSAL